MAEKDIVAAKALLADPNISTKDVAKRLNVSESMLYRHLIGRTRQINCEEGAHSHQPTYCA